MKIKRIIIIFIFMSLFITTASANAPHPASYLHIRIINMPDNAVYADLLIKIKDTDKRYTELEYDNIEKFNISEDSEIVTYNKDGYRSFTFHYKKAQSMIEIYTREKLPAYKQEDYKGETGYVNFGFDPFDSSGIIFNKQFNDLINDYSEIMIALTDKNGNILSISDKTDIASPKLGGYLYGWLTYDVTNGNVEVDKYEDNITFFIVSIIGILLTIILETLIAVFFKLKPYIKIVLVNIMTQIIMRLLAIISPLQYLLTLFILEALVYIWEYSIYGKLYRDISKRKILVFTVTANTLSLIIGLIVNYVIYNI